MMWLVLICHEPMIDDRLVKNLPVLNDKSQITLANSSMTSITLAGNINRTNTNNKRNIYKHPWATTIENGISHRSWCLILVRSGLKPTKSNNVCGMALAQKRQQGMKGIAALPKLQCAKYISSIAHVAQQNHMPICGHPCTMNQRTWKHIIRLTWLK